MALLEITNRYQNHRDHRPRRVDRTQSRSVCTLHSTPLPMKLYSKALDYVFSKDKDFLHLRSIGKRTEEPEHPLRIRRPMGAERREPKRGRRSTPSSTPSTTQHSTQIVK